MSKGKLIVIEGAIDGIGKTTQFNLLKERLKKENINLINRHFPSYGKEQGRLVELYLSGQLGDKKAISPYEINSYYAIDRAITWRNELNQIYEKGGIVLLDRYTTSSLIYQSAFITDPIEKKKFIDYVSDFEYNKLLLPQPTKVIYLHGDFDLITDLRNKRQTNEGILNDIHENDLEYLKKVYESSLFVANYLNWDKIECTKNNELRTSEDIHEEVYNLIKKR